MKVFLGGTCNNSSWREELIPQLEIEYYNPVVEDWTPECMEEEIKQRKEADYCLFVITSEMTGVYSIAEVIDDSNKKPRQTVFAFVKDGFTEAQIKSLVQVGRMVTGNGGRWIDFENVAPFLNESAAFSVTTVEGQ